MRPNINRETKMTKKHKINISYKDDDTINVKLWDAANMAVLSQEAIEGYINEGVSYLLNNPEESVWYSRCADTVVLITRDGEDDIDIVVCTPRLHGHAEIN